jgi:phosphatidylserine synthase
MIRFPTARDVHFATKAAIGSFIAVAVIALFLFVWYSVYVLFLLFAGVLVRSCCGRWRRWSRDTRG